MTPEQIQSKYALTGENLPNQIVEVEVPEVTLMQVGYAGADSWGTGGGVQFEAMQMWPESAFGAPADLAIPSIPTELPMVKFPEEPILSEGDYWEFFIP